MPYLGFFDDLYADDKDVDISKLADGKIIINGKECDADSMIDESDRLSMFNDCSMRYKSSLLWSIKHHLKSIEEESKDNKKHSPAYYARYKELIERFKVKVEACEFPEHLEDWWHYEYSVYETGVTLQLAHVSWFDFDRDDDISEEHDTVFDLLKVSTKLLTVEQYAQAYGVTTTTVRQWIRRGKLRSAIKRGSEWRIPELCEPSGRGYQIAAYDRKEYLTDLPQGYEFLNDYDFVRIMQNRDKKELFDVYFGYRSDERGTYEEKAKKKKPLEMQMDIKEREKFELYLISNPFVQSVSNYITGRS